MIPQAINYEVLLLTGSRSSQKPPCNKKCDHAKNCPVQLNYATMQVKRIARFLICFFEKYSPGDFEIAPTIIQTKSFVHLRTISPVENKHGNDPHSFFSVENSN